ncbi:MAG: NAD-dependent epimerase/dehydratase family protein [Magnetococcales bacterium]|nr:NAD-dependent epimerase/dehydratase family protein [Magnetococcales bacterium]
MKNYCLPGDIAEIATRLGHDADLLAGKSILMTGGGGFLGRYFINLFAHLNATRLKEPCRLTVLDNLITTPDADPWRAWFRSVENDHIRFIQHDVMLPFQEEGRVDYIIHAAGIASPFYYRAYPLETLEVSVMGTRNMLETAHRHRARMVFFSSSEIYGDPDPRYVPTPESYRGNVACQGPRACYDESKRVGETLCYIFHNYHGVHANIIRPFNVYGPGMQKTDYRILPNFAACLQEGKPLSVYNTGNQTRTFCYITDAMTGFTLTLLKGVPGATYNIGAPGPEVSVLDLVAIMQKNLNREIPYKIIEYPNTYPGDEPNRRCPDIRNAEIQLGYRSQVGLEDGLRRFFGWTAENF